MKNKSKKKIMTTEMRKEYDFSGSKPNRFYKRYQSGTNIVIIDPDLIKLFPTSSKVNEALRFLNSLMNATKKYQKEVL